ncbi:MAG: allantoate amidohydrolase [Candidatus Dormibacterales bacterium]
MVHDLAGAAMERCDVLATCSEDSGRLTRPFATDSMRRAHDHVRGWLGTAGMQVRADNVGNLRGRYEAHAPDGPTLILGSHLDSVRGAGKYDGPLGVLVAIAAVQSLHDSGTRLPFAIEVIAFADEEGLRFGTTYLGSRAVAGTFDVGELARKDGEGTTMGNAIRRFGGDPERIEDDGWHGGPLIGYCEVHIEQGPVLESRDLPVGVVSAIAGQNRYEISIEGEAGHAGTVPMDQRKDALAAAAELVVAAEAIAGGLEDVVATVGSLTVSPGATNVIPGRVDLSLDVRHAGDAAREHAAQTILMSATDIARRRSVRLSVRTVSENASVPCSPRLVSLLSRAVENAGHPAVTLASGAGHDGVAMSALTEIGMLFIRCKGGVSHNPAESVTAADVAVAIAALGGFLSLLAGA